MLDKAHLYDISPCGYISFYADGTVVSANQTLLNWLELPDENALYQKKFSTLLSAGGRLYYQMVMMPTLFRQGSVNEINVDIKTSKGDTFPCLLNAAVVSQPESDKVLITAVVLKITDRKKLEAELQKEKRMAEEASKRLEALANIIPDIIFTANTRGEIDFVNKRFFEKFNISPDDSFKYSSVFDRFHPADQEDLSRRWIQAFASGTPFESESRIRMADGTYCWYLIKAVPYTNEDGEITQWFGSCTDIHAHKEAQLATVKQLNASLSEAGEIISQQDQTLEEISYYQSHSVRKPLANILGLIQMMNTEDVQEIRSSLLPMLQQSAEELDEVIKSIVS